MTPLLAIAVLLGPPVELGIASSTPRRWPRCRRDASRGRCSGPRRRRSPRIGSKAAGCSSATPALFGVHGASWTDTTWRLGDIDVTDPDRGGTPLIAVPVEALESLTLATALTPVAAAGSGAQVALAVREPAASWRGALALAHHAVRSRGLRRRRSAPHRVHARLG